MKRTLTLTILALAILLLPVLVSAQGKVVWLSVGSLHNWYSEFGSEIEHGNQPIQQYGLRWPAQYNYQDMQAAKGMWIGVRDFKDPAGTLWDYRVAHVGPRVRGTGEVFPVSMDMYSKKPLNEVYVDGIASYGELPEIKAIVPTMASDRMLVNRFNTLLGASVTRTIHAFANPFHDNYHISEYVIKNTGIVDGSNNKVLNDTLKGLYLHLQFRYSVVRETRYLVTNSSGWGVNNMNDARGVAGLNPTGDAFNLTMIDPRTGAYDQVRAAFSWHGRHTAANAQTAPGAPAYDNIGAPIWNPSLSAGFIAASDTVGRLGAPQFVGNATLFASLSAAQPNIDDTTQPKTTSWEDSDHPETSSNSAFNRQKMETEYKDWLAKGHKFPRHAWTVEPGGFGNFISPTGDPSLAKSGGWSNATAWGPYNIPPGDSVVIVIAEGADGLTREEAIRIGMRFRGLLSPTITAAAKNDSVIRTGHRRLFEMFRKAKANYTLIRAGNSILEPPEPPATFQVTGQGDKINLQWTPSPTSGVTGYNIYRARARRDSTYYLIAPNVSPGVTEFNDTTALRGDQYYYYITAIKGTVPLNSPSREPAGAALESNRFFTQTYDPAYLKRAPGTSMSQIRIAPNPYIKSADENNLRFPGERDKIAFFNIPGRCKISIYTEIGELVHEIMHTNGSGDQFWNSNTRYGQVVASGIYIVVFENLDTGERTIQKLAVIR